MITSLKQSLQKKIIKFKGLPTKKKIIYVLLSLILISIIVISVIVILKKDKSQDKGQISWNAYHIALKKATFIPGETVCVDVEAGQFPGEYPALSFQFDFDPTQLEFLSLKQGNITIIEQSTQRKILPEWSYQKELANRDGKIRTMYLDMTAGEVPFKFDQLSEGKNVLFRIEFKVRDSCSTGDEVEISFGQATFATIDESNSLSMQKGNVKCHNGNYVVESPIQEVQSK
ncbi:MAG: cohesin domain-containing protein [Clostridiales bacterium]|nr:cohesin domain-containing protein [Clostridiales bacterium]